MKQLLIAMFALLLVTPLALGSMTVSVDDMTSEPFSVVVGQTLPIEVVYNLSGNYSDVKVEAELSYGSKDVEVSSEAIDVIAGTTYKQHLEVTVPKAVDTDTDGEEYKLNVRLKDGRGDNLGSKDFRLTVQRSNDVLDIQKVLGNFNAEAGKPTILTVVVKNTGAHEMEDVYVRVTSPELGLDVEERAGDIAATDEDDEEDVATIDVPLRMPKDAVEGKYTLNIKVYNDDVEATATKNLWVSGTKKAADSTEVVPVVKSLEIRQGETALYQLNLLNLGNSAQTYSITAEGTDGWATYQVNPLSVKLNPQTSQLVTLGLTVSENALAGEHSVKVNVLSDGKEVRELTLTANVEKASKVSTMLVSVVVLAVVLVVLLVLLVKLRKSDDEETTESEESYY